MPPYTTNDKPKPATVDYVIEIRGIAVWTAICGAFMLYYGLREWESLLDSPLYAFAVHTWAWTLRIGGGAMLVIALLALTGMKIAARIDAVASVVVALMFAFTGVIFLFHGDNDGILSLIFTAVFAHAGWRSWRLWMQIPISSPHDSGITQARHVIPNTDTDPSGRSATQAPEPPPPEGYLAALARENQNERRNP